MRPAIVCGIVTGVRAVQLLATFFPGPSNSPRSLCERKFGPVMGHLFHLLLYARLKFNSLLSWVVL